MSAMRRYGARSLRFKFVLASVAVEALMLAALIWNSVRIADDALNEIYRDRVETLAPALNAGLADLLAQRDYATLDERLARLVRRGSLVYVEVRDATGNLAARRGDLPSSPRLDTAFSSADGVFDQAIDLTVAGEVVGRARYGLNVSLLEKTRSTLKIQGGVLASIEIALTIALLAMLGYLLTRHLRALARAARALEGGDYAARAEVAGEDEVADTARAFNTMAATIERDIGERELAEGKVRRLNRVHAVQSGINAVIVRVKSRAELFEQACRIAVQAGRFNMAWIGSLERATMSLAPAAFAGEGARRAAFIQGRSMAEGEPAAASLTARAIREKKVLFSNDTQRDPAVLFKQLHSERGTRSLAILPLLAGGEVAAVLSLYAEEVGFFNPAELALLEDLAADLSFALDHLKNAEKLEYLASYDPLTGLANGALFQERLAQHLAAAGGARRGLAVFVLDIERFKDINDTLGRPAGDELLRQIAARLSGLSGEPERFARVGTDVFAAVAPAASTEGEALRLAEHKLARCFGAPFPVAGNELKVSVRFGIAMFPEDGADAGVLFRHAEAALKKAKSGGDRILFYTQQMTARVAENLALENQLRRALERDEFVLHYQPKVELGARRIVGVEALLRWRHPERGLLPPMSFVPLLEQSGLILPVGAWLLQQAVRDYRGWAARGLEAPRIALNVSPVQLRQRDFVAGMAAAIGGGAAPAGIDLEITESLIMQDVEATAGKLKALRDLGIRLSIDDFGTGFSSLGYLAKLPVHTLKIDRSFIIAMLRDSDTMTLVQTVISLAHALRLTVIAEGVDEEEQAKILRLLRCDEMQGCLYSEPLPLAAITALLENERERPRQAPPQR